MATKTFEASLRHLEKLVSKMENEQLPLEESLASFEEAVNVTQSCQKALDNARLRIEKITSNLKVDV
jgi:exodeoxyribonuclease VII small subunit